jgi:hypothetical protein
MKQQTDGIVSFHVSINVTPAEMRDWKPERIKAFFAGVAMARRAAAGIEPGIAEQARERLASLVEYLHAEIGCNPLNESAESLRLMAVEEARKNIV